LCGLLLLNKQDTRVKIDGIYKLGEIYQMSLNTANSSICLKCAFKLFPIPLLQAAELLYKKENMPSLAQGGYTYLQLLQDSGEVQNKQKIIACCELKVIIIRDLISKIEVQIKN
jgi:hypothetical protein